MLLARMDRCAPVASRSLEASSLSARGLVRGLARADENASRWRVATKISGAVRTVSTIATRANVPIAASGGARVCAARPAFGHTSGLAGALRALLPAPLAGASAQLKRNGAV